MTRHGYIGDKSTVSESLILLVQVKGRMTREDSKVEVTGILKGIEESIETPFGNITVTIYGDRSKTPCIAYHEVGTNHQTCFQSLLVASGPQSLILRNFFLIFIDAPGCEVRLVVSDAAE